jgi:hypothetical protein
MFLPLPFLSLAQVAPAVEPAPPQPEVYVVPQSVRPLPGELDAIPVFNSNSPELVQTPGILLSTFPPAGMQDPSAHLDYPLQGRFDVFAHHIARAPAPDDLRSLYLGILVHNPGTTPATLSVLQGASYLSQPDAPFIELPAQVNNQSGAVYAGPGSRVGSDILRGRRQAGLPFQLEIPPGESRMLLNEPIPVRELEPPLNGRSTLIRLFSDSPVYVASLAQYAPQIDSEELEELEESNASEESSEESSPENQLDHDEADPDEERREFRHRENQAEAPVEDAERLEFLNLEDSESSENSGNSKNSNNSDNLANLENEDSSSVELATLEVEVLASEDSANADAEDADSDDIDSDDIDLEDADLEDADRYAERPPTLAEWQALLRQSGLAGPRDRTPTPPNAPGQIIYGRVAGVSQGSQWQAQLADLPNGRTLRIPNPGTSYAYGISLLRGGRLGTNQIQTAPLLVRYPDTAYSAHGNYGVQYSLTLPLHNSTGEQQTVEIALQTPIKEDQLSTAGLQFFEPLPPQTFFRGTVQIRYQDYRGRPREDFVHLVQRRGQASEPFLKLKMPPEAQQTVQIDLIYPADATPPQVVTVSTRSRSD